jgi:hypothetical protein
MPHGHSWFYAVPGKASSRRCTAADELTSQAAAEGREKDPLQNCITACLLVITWVGEGAYVRRR